MEASKYSKSISLSVLDSKFTNLSNRHLQLRTGYSSAGSTIHIVSMKLTATELLTPLSSLGLSLALGLAGLALNCLKALTSLGLKALLFKGFIHQIGK